MRRFLQQITTFLFAGGLLVAVIGIPVNDHYCSGTYYTTTIGLPLDDPCGDMPVNNDCCHDETTLFSLTDIFNPPSIAVLVQSVSPAILTCNYTECIKIVPIAVAGTPLITDSPPLGGSKIFVRVQSLLL